MKLYAVVESGSTKSDWVIFDTDKNIRLRTSTAGLNPLILSEKEIISVLQEKEELSKFSEGIAFISFYGAGCKNPDSVQLLNSALRSVFINSEITILTDLHAACLSVYAGEPCMVGILGTGSNACFFDGKHVITKISSLGYLIGDEGSGNHIGKELLRAYYYRKMPDFLSDKFQNNFDLNLDSVLDNLYRKSGANVYLAGISRFAFENKQEPFIQKTVASCFNEFIENMILPIAESRVSEHNFVGSVAWYYQDILKTCVEGFSLQFGRVQQRPMESLLKYHFRNL